MNIMEALPYFIVFAVAVVGSQEIARILVRRHYDKKRKEAKA